MDNAHTHVLITSIGTRQKHNVKEIQAQESLCLRQAIDIPWYIRKTTTFRDLGIKQDIDNAIKVVKKTSRLRSQELCEENDKDTLE